MAKRASAKAKSKAKQQVAPKLSRFLKRRRSEEAALRSLDEQFPIASVAFKTMHRVGGKTMFDRVLQDKRAAKKQGSNLGPTYLVQLRLEFFGDDHKAGFAVADDTQPIDPLLVGGLDAARTVNTNARAKTKLELWLDTCAACTQRESSVG